MSDRATSRRGLTKDQVGAVLAGKFDVVLSEMPNAHGWRGAPVQVMEDALSDTVEAVLREHDSTPYTDENLVAGAVRAGVKLRAKQHWWRRRERKSGQDHIELTADTDGLPSVYDDHDATVDALSAAALMPFARDCLAELTERQAQIIRLQADGLGLRTIAREIGLERKDIQRELRYAEKAIGHFAMVLEAGRVCGKRAPAIAAYTDGVANPDDIRRAAAHLDVCPQCHAAFIKTKSALGAQVAALVPVPALAVVATHGRGGGIGGIFARVGDFVGLGGNAGGRMEAIRETALGVLARNPASAETLTGAGLGGAGIAVGTKAVIGLCVATLAGGSAVCSSLGVLPDGLNIRQPVKEHQAEHPKAKKPAARTTSTPPVAAVVTPPVITTLRTAPPQAALNNSLQGAAAARKARRKQQRVQAAKRRARAATAAAVNPLQSSAPTAAPTAVTSAATPPSTPPVQAPSAPTQSSPPKSTGTASPALTGQGGGFENGTP